jgi:hypothetical protein
MLPSLPDLGISDAMSDAYVSTFGGEDDAAQHQLRQRVRVQAEEGFGGGVMGPGIEAYGRDSTAEHGRRTGFGSADVTGGAAWQGGGQQQQQKQPGSFGSDLSSGGSLGDLDSMLDDSETYRDADRDGSYGSVGRWMRDTADYVLSCTA